MSGLLVSVRGSAKEETQQGRASKNMVPARRRLRRVLPATIDDVKKWLRYEVRHGGSVSLGYLILEGLVERST